MYDELAVERKIQQNFSIIIDINKMITFEAPASPTLRTTIFLTKKKQLYAYIEGRSSATLGDVRKVVSNMGMVAEAYLPPSGDADYFDDIATKHYQKTFPGRKPSNPDDLRYYRTLAPYLPALVLIREVKEGVIKRYDSDSSTKWRPLTQLSYKKISPVESRYRV